MDRDEFRTYNDEEIEHLHELELMILKDFYLKGENIYLKDKFGNKFKIITTNENKVMHSKEIVINEKIDTNKRILL